jgi:hypothetical protein
MQSEVKGLQIHFLCKKSLLLGSKINLKINRREREIQLQGQDVALICIAKKTKEKSIRGFFKLVSFDRKLTEKLNDI